MIESPTALHRRAYLPLPTALLHHLLFCAPACKTWQLFEKLLGFFFFFFLLCVTRIERYYCSRGTSKPWTICHRCPPRSGFVDNVRIEIYYTYKNAHAQSIRHCSPIYLFKKIKPIYSVALCGNSGDYLSFAALHFNDFSLS